MTKMNNLVVEIVAEAASLYAHSADDQPVCVLVKKQVRNGSRSDYLHLSKRLKLVVIVSKTSVSWLSMHPYLTGSQQQ